MQSTRLLAGILFVALITGGCVSPPKVAPSTPTSATPVLTAVDAGASREQQVLSCEVGDDLTESITYDLLVSISHYESFEYLTGPAKSIATGWRDLYLAGWAPDTNSTWASSAWRQLAISHGSDGAYVVRLTFGDGSKYNTGTTDFEVVCDNRRWLVRNTGLQGKWITPPSTVPGQTDSLTPETAIGLVRQATYGPWLAQVATGEELERGRVHQLDIARGEDDDRERWPGMSPMIRVQSADQNRATGEWLDSAGAPMGEMVQFERVNGLWKISNHTEGGKWLHVSTGRGETGKALFFSTALFDIKLGMDPSQVKAILGQPDKIERNGGAVVFHYLVRGILVKFDENNKVTMVSGTSGATRTGIFVGAPITMVQLVYGPSQNNSYSAAHQSLNFATVDGRVTEISLVRID